MKGRFINSYQLSAKWEKVVTLIAGDCYEPPPPQGLFGGPLKPIKVSQEAPLLRRGQIESDLYNNKPWHSSQLRLSTTSIKRNGDLKTELTEQLVMGHFFPELEVLSSRSCQQLYLVYSSDFFRPKIQTSAMGIVCARQIFSSDQSHRYSS
jgi:hypothetical protein